LWALLAVVAAAGCWQSADPAPPKSGGSADASVSSERPNAAANETRKPESPAGSALLLGASAEEAPLQDGPEGIRRPPKPARGKVADNNRCHVCHANFSEERLAVAHARADIGCEKCHGPSDEHCGDEGNVTPPTTMFAKADIDPSCKKCHPDDRPTENGVCPVVVLDENKGCTDCHGRHRMAQRTVRWDKATRKVLPKATAKG
jgi:hypothetical protein